MRKDDLRIREERPEDHGVITDVTVAAFSGLEISDQTEHLMIERLREADALTLSLVAELRGEVVGHIAFSPANISDGTSDWYCLGPVSVLPEHQRQGIGGALIREGLARLRAEGARGCCLAGHPEYYGRFGFINPEGLCHDGVSREAFFALSFSGKVPEGRVTFHPAFGDEA